jgi:signal transduction histidine kinase
VSDQREQLAARVADSLAVGVWLVDPDGETLFRSAGLDGLAPGVASLPELARSLPGVPLLGYLRAVSLGGAPVEEPAVLLRAGDRTRMVQLRLAVGPPDYPGSVLITLEEVSQRLRVERLRALAETTIALSHEINNPLAVLSGEIELIRRDGGVAEDRVESLKGAVGRIADVLQRLRRLAEPLETDYLPSRGVRMLNLANGGAATRTGAGTGPGTGAQAVEGAGTSHGAGPDRAGSSTKRWGGAEQYEASSKRSHPHSNPTEEVA